MKETKKFAFDVGITFIATMITTIVGFILSIFLARYLGPSDLGVYREALTFYSLASLICAIGIPPALIKYLAEFKDNKTKTNQFVSSAIITSLFLGILSTIFFYFTSGLFADIFKMPLLSDLIKVLAFVFPFVLINNVLLAFLNGLRKMNIYSLGVIIQNISMIIITLILVYNNWGAMGAIIGIILSSVILSIFLIINCRNEFDFTFKLFIGYNNGFPSKFG